MNDFLSHSQEDFVVKQKEQNREELWKKDEEIIQAVIQKGLQEVFEALPQKEKIFEQGKKLKICCIDGRMHTNEEDCMYVREGGSGILRTTEVNDIANRYVELAEKLGVKEVELTRHEDCGAEIKSGLDEESIVSYHKLLKEKIQEKNSQLKVLLSTIDNKTDEGKDLHSIHSERGIYFINNVFPFNPEKGEGLPQGFVFHGVCSDNPEYRIANAAVAIGIAFGNHGFGNRFSKEQPFLLMAIANSEENANLAAQELEQAKQQFINAQSDKNIAQNIVVKKLIVNQ